MKKDFKNVIITFGLIIFVATWGSLVYKKNIENDQLLIVQQGKLKDAKILADQIKKQSLLKKQIAQTQIALNNIQNQSTPNATAQADALKQKALLLAEQQAQIAAQQKANQAIAKQKAQALAQAQIQMQMQNTMPVSRRSRAS